MRTIIILCLVLCVLCFQPAAATETAPLTAQEIIARSERAVNGDSQAALAEITVKTRRWTRTMRLKSFVDRTTRRSFAEIMAPAKDAGNRFLLIDTQMWHYVPKLQQTIKISPSMMLQSWMGSDFTNDDIVKESSILTDYDHKLIGEIEIDTQQCYQIELTPLPDAAVVWGKIIYFARLKDYLPVREEFYNERGKMKKFMIFDRFEQRDDRIVPTRYKMQTVNKKDRYTLMEILAVKYDRPIPETYFTMQHLKRR